MRLTAGALAALVLAVLGLVLAIDAASRVGSDGLAVTVMLVAAGGSAIVAGAMAALHRPDSAFGVLLEAAGCLWFVSEWNSPTAGSAMVFTVGLICWAAFPIVAAHAALAFPSGRLVSPVDRLLIIAGYAVFVGLIGLVPTLVFDPVAQGCRACASNLVLVTSSPALVGVFGGWGAGCAVLVATSLAVLGVVRLVRSTPAARRMKAVVLGPSVLLLLAVAISFVRAVNPATVPQDQLSRVLWWVQAAALTALSAGVVVDWIRLRRARSRIAAFVIALGVGGRTGDIRAALAAALHDPSLDVAYPLADGRLVSASGEPAPAADDDRATTALVRGNSTVALIRHQRDLLGDPALVREVVSAARLPLDNERLSAEARAQLTELGASRVRIIESGEAERRRLERDLHDGAQQRLVALALGVRLARSTTSDPENAARFDRAAELLGSAIADLRRLASGIYPSVLADTGLSGGLSALAEESDHPVRISDVPRGRLALVVEATAYLLVAAVCRCGAVTVRAAVDDGALKLAIDADAIPENLIDVTDRINALGGSITVGPSAGGWSVRAELPCAS